MNCPLLAVYGGHAGYGVLGVIPDLCGLRTLTTPFGYAHWAGMESASWEGLG